MLEASILIDCYVQADLWAVHKFKRIAPQSRLPKAEVLQGLMPLFINRYNKTLKAYGA